MSDRYKAVVQDAARRGSEAIIRRFEAATAGSKAVITRSYGDTMRLAAADSNVYSTYYRMLDSELRIPEGCSWDVLTKTPDRPDPLR